ncbi:PIG-L deacetylase family protein [Paenibacillus lautus]|uniref:PIG-L deacetylase family protein n=1 Tax=Paenibacillus lautus TaxID=1401 RepID=UPI001C115D32|nr:PIG-L deacetylase family protein [Paenibacillus lautus]MBU5350615.1 PIG-L family deacetylase [Paenibacillus lautus]
MLESGKERILIFVPHADDEVLGCGGLIEKACRFNNTVKVVLASVGNTFFWHREKPVSAKTRKKEFSAALKYLGCDDWDIMYEDKESILDTIPRKEIVTKIDKYLTEFNPTMVFLPYPSFNQDHQVLSESCMTGLRPIPDRHYKVIAMYEYPLIVWQYPKLADVGELYLDISDTIDKKVEALRKHKSQLREPRHLISPESVREWAAKRGMEVGFDYAEKYHLIRATLF